MTETRHPVSAPSRPRILLVGAGRFGRQHLLEWRRLQEEGRAEVAGIVVRSEASRATLTACEGLPVYVGFDAQLLEKLDVDAVDVVTPPISHAEIVASSLPHAHVLVEKPLATTAQEARRLEQRARELNRVLMVGHLYRHHPTVIRLREIVRSLGTRPRAILGRMLNPEHDLVGRAEASLEFLHLYDVVDYLFEDEPEVSVAAVEKNVTKVSLRYPGPMNAVLRLGWQGSERVRELTLVYEDRDVCCNLVDNSIVTQYRANQVEKEFFPRAARALRNELVAFLERLGNGAAADGAPGLGSRIVHIATRALPPVASDRPRAAVVGGGIFGLVIASELGEFCDVQLFERHDDVMTEVSFLNQWRHHSGFHYPRSYDQIQEIRAARGEFEAEFGPAIRRSYPAYFCTSASGVEIPAERYLAACASNYLSFTIEDPPPEVLDRSRVSICLRSDEGVYDFFKLKELVLERVRRRNSVRMHLGAEVVDGEILPTGAKRLRVVQAGEERAEEFDYVVNATYANRNLVAKWFGFPIEPIHFSIYELLVLRLPIPQICVTIMDGPFTSLVGMGYDDLFMLSHIHDSVLHSVITEDGLPPPPRPVRSNRDNMLAHSARYLPILEKAEVLESRFALRAVNAFQKDFDARPTVVKDHGFGVWSVLGGKILTCVSNAREIAASIRAELAATLSKS